MRPTSQLSISVKLLTGLLFFITLSVASSLEAAAKGDCGELAQEVGPFDYNDPKAKSSILKIVEKNHFNANVRNLIRGQSDTIMGDLDFVLRAFPNHHGALNSLARYSLSGGKKERFYTADCYFSRAIKFTPKDSTVYLIYAIYLHKQKKIDEAIVNYKKSIELLNDPTEAYYNLALSLVAKGLFKEARKYAVKAYQGKYPLQGLKLKLKSVGHWGDNEEIAIKTKSK